MGRPHASLALAFVLVSRVAAAADVGPGAQPAAGADGTAVAAASSAQDASAGPPLVVDVAGDRAPPRSASEVVLEQSVLTAAPHRTAGDLLGVAPGVHLTQHSGEGKAYQIFYRGFDAVHGQDLEIWAGGAPVNDVSNIHGQGYADLHFLMPEVVKDVRVAPGTYDLRQGDFAVAGSMHLGLGLAEPGVTAKATVGEFGTRRYFMAYRPKDAPDDTFAAFEVYATDGFGPSRAARRVSGVAQATHDFGSLRGRLMVSSYAGRFDSAGVLRLSDVESGAVDRFATYDPKQGGDSARTQVVLELSEAGEGGRWSVAPFFVLRSLDLRSDYTGFLLDPVNGDTVLQQNDAVTFGMNARYRMPVPIVGKRDAIEAGVYARADRITQSQRRLSVLDGHVTKDEVDAQVRASDVAGYLDLTLHPIRRVLLRGGARIDGLFYAVDDAAPAARGARSAQGAHVGPKATLEVNLAPGLAAVGSFGQGFRSPQARSLADGQTTPFTEVTSFEAGLRYAGDGLRATAAAFRTLLSEDLVFDQATARNEHVPGTARTGLAADFTALPVEWFVSSASVTYTRAVFRASGDGFVEGALLPYVPQLVVRADLAFTPTITEVFSRSLVARIGGGVTFLDRRPLPYAEMGHDVLLLDATASARLKELELGVDVFNLLDARTYDGEYVYASNFTQGAAPSLVPVRHVTVGAPRTVLFRAAIHL
jgi:outer membrane cobalamin receptor